MKHLIRIALLIGSVVTAILIAFIYIAVVRPMNSQEDLEKGVMALNLDHFEEAYLTLNSIANESDPAKRSLALLLAAGKGTTANPELATQWLDRDLQSSLAIKMQCPQLLFRSTLPAKKYSLAENLTRLQSPQADQWFKEAKDDGYNPNDCWLKRH